MNIEEKEAMIRESQDTDKIMEGLASSLKCSKERIPYAIIGLLIGVIEKQRELIDVRLKTLEEKIKHE